MARFNNVVIARDEGEGDGSLHQKVGNFGTGAAIEINI